MPQLKIDVTESGSYIYPFAVYRKLPNDWRGRERWERLEKFEKLEEAKAFFEKIKELPIYDL
jgi:hypothetical protein